MHCRENSKKMNKWKTISVIENGIPIKSFELDERGKLIVKYPKMKQRKLIFEFPKLINSNASTETKLQQPVESQPTESCFKAKGIDNNNKNNSIPLSNNEPNKSVFSSFEKFDSPYNEIDIFNDDFCCIGDSDYDLNFFDQTLNFNDLF